jgi:site-specific DNA-methyltransferase (adenine-specific)
MEAMASMKDNEFDLSIVDPPYGIEESGAQSGGETLRKNGRRFSRKELLKWDKKPSQKYFDNLLRVSKNTIIWGGNYFSDKIPVSRCWICWDKKQPWKTFSQIELAWTSFTGPSPIFYFDNRYAGKIHPTQKPIALYTWLLDKYAQKGWKILDTHLGSGSSAIAAHDMGFEFHGYELDTEYYEGASKRLKAHQQQLQLF